jgi:hypothetical protein
MAFLTVGLNLVNAEVPLIVVVLAKQMGAGDVEIGSIFIIGGIGGVVGSLVVGRISKKILVRSSHHVYHRKTLEIAAPRGLKPSEVSNRASATGEPNDGIGSNWAVDDLTEFGDNQPVDGAIQFARKRTSRGGGVARARRGVHSGSRVLRGVAKTALPPARLWRRRK